MNYLLNNHNISYLIKSFVSLLLLFWMLGYMNCAQRENFWGWFFGISGHTVTFWLVMMVIRAACMSDGDGSQILTKWWMVIISGPPPLCTYGCWQALRVDIPLGEGTRYSILVAYERTQHCCSVSSFVYAICVYCYYCRRRCCPPWWHSMRHNSHKRGFSAKCLSQEMKRLGKTHY